MIGQILRQRYKIVSQLGGGGFGTTYLAEDLDLPTHPKCVVKQLHPQAIAPEIVRRFEKEGEILYKLGQKRDRIPKLFAYFEESGQFYLVQEFVEGRDLSDEIGEGKRWSEAQTLAFLREVLEILAFVHQNNVIHRDIKPANIMRRSRDGNLVLIDFGIVKEITTAVANSQGQITNTIAIGTPGYMPSEQAMRQPRFSSDIYALGMTAIEALTGVPPSELPTDNNGEIVWRNRATVSDSLAEILSKMTRYHFSYRYANATEALQALSGNASTAATLAVSPNRPPTATQAHVPRAQNSGKLLLAGGLTAIAVVAGLFLAFKPKSPQTASEPAPNETRSPQTTPEVTISPIPPNVQTPSPQTTPEVAPSPNVQTPSPQTTPEVTPSPVPQTSNSQAVPIFPVDTLRTDVESFLGAPDRDLRGVYDNTRAVIYQSVQQGVDLGFLFDRDSRRIRQTEASFKEFVEPEVMNRALENMLRGQMSADIQQGLQNVQQRQLNYYRFSVGSLKGQIVRQDCDDIYISIWDAQLHDFVSFNQSRRC
ncbi:protein kinase domain-containing protein [Lusitaniella coriacea]|uniref:protein kinase domain-containing protein n=1 Tax=Lusitaniella coriacea TaxID=1983105 RepID=UPI003CEE8588